jgi:putative addiction module component (TIGR02574 family)
MSGLMQKFGIDQLSVEQRLALIEEIWASIDGETLDAAQLSDAQRAEFESRMFGDDLDDEDLNDLWEIEELAAFSRGKH